jgi:DNA-binding response OmpR family regulator
MAKLVCVVDDDDLVRHTIALNLQAHGVETVEVDDGYQVSEVLSNRAVDALVVDMIMPGKDGVEVISEARKARPDMRIVAVSGGGRFGSNFYLNLAGHIGADACLAKPFSGEALMAALG